MRLQSLFRLRYTLKFILFALIVLCCTVQVKLYAQVPQQELRSFSTIERSTDSIRVARLLQEASAINIKDPDKATLLSKEALLISLNTRFNRGIAKSLLNLGTYSFNKGDYNRSRSFFYEAAPYCYAANSENNDLIYTLYNNLACVCKVQGKLDSAIHYYFKSLAVIKKGKSDQSLMFAYTNIGGTLAADNQGDKAIIYLNKGLLYAIKLKDTLMIAVNYYNIGAAIYETKKQFDSAISYFQNARIMYQSVGSKRDVEETYARMGMIAGAEGHLNMAKTYFDSSMFVDPQDATNNTTLQEGLGDIYVAQGAYRKAIPYYQRVEDIYKNSGVSKPDIYYSLARCYYKIGNKDLAYKYLKAYTNTRDSLLSEEKIKIANTLEVKYRTAGKDKEIAQNQAQIALKEKEAKVKNTLIVALSGGFLLLVGLLFSLYRSNRHKQKIQEGQLLNLQQEQRINMLHAQMEGVDLERKRLAQELHDGIGGMLAAVKMNFSILEQKHFTLKFDAGYSETLQLLTDTASEIRQTAHNLMPGLIVQQGLEAALRQYCDKINAGQNELTIEFQAYGMDGALNDELKRAVFHIVQELVQNVLKHAKATYALVQLSIHNGLLHILIEDNGIGLPMQNATGPRGLGLSTLQDRVNILGGHCTIETEAGKGTAIDIEFELEKDEMAISS